MKIAVVCDVLGSETNGTVVAAMNLIRSLISKGHDVNILCADQSKKGIDKYFVVPNLSLGILDKFIEMNNVTLATIDKEVIDEALHDREHIHIMLPFILGRYAVKYAMNKGISVTAGFHAQAENLSSHLRMQNVEFINRAIYKNFYRDFYRYVDGIHFPTKFIRDDFEKRIHKKTNAFVISNGVNRDVIKKDIIRPNELKDKIIILSTGRYSVEKDQATLIKAIKLSKYHDKIQLVLAGQGPLLHKYKMLAKDCDNAVIFKIYNHDELIEMINMCDLYVHPAIIELEGIACIEAISVGKLVITSDSKKSATKGFVVDDKCIFRHGNANSLAKTIDYWLSDNYKRKWAEDAYFASRDLYDLDKCMDKMEEMMFTVHNNYHKK